MSLSTWGGLPGLARQFLRGRGRGSALAGQFETPRKDMGPAINNAARGSRWQMGMVQRQARCLMDMATSVFAADDVRRQCALAPAIRGTANARAQLVTAASRAP